MLLDHILTNSQKKVIQSHSLLKSIYEIMSLLVVYEKLHL